MTKVVFSNTIQSGDARIVIRGDLASQLAKLKQQDGVDIILSGGPATLGPIASTPGLVDEYLIAVHPAVVTAGSRMFGRLSRDLLWNSYTPRCSTPAAWSSTTGR